MKNTFFFKEHVPEKGGKIGRKIKKTFCIPLFHGLIFLNNHASSLKEEILYLTLVIIFLLYSVLIFN